MARFLDTTFSALKHRDYRYYWSGQAISLMGTSMQSAALAWLVYQSTGSPMLLALLGVFQFGPLIVLALPAGVYIDRWPKRKVAIITQTVFMLQALALSLLAFSGRASYQLVLPLASIYGITQAFDNPCRRAFIVDLVGKADLMNAVSLNSATGSLARIIGPSLGGIVMARLGGGWAFLLNALSYLAVIVSLMRISVEGRPSLKPRDKHLGQEMLEGLRHIWQKDLLRIGVAITLVLMIFGLNENVLVPVFTDQVLGLGAEAYGFMLSAIGAGALIGALLGAAISHRVSSGRLMVVGGLVTALIQIVVAAVGTLWLSTVLMVLFGVASILFANASAALVQVGTDEHVLGRVMSVYALVQMGTLPVGNAFAGAVMGLWGGGAGFLVCGAVTAVLLLGVLVVERRRVRDNLLAE